MAQMPIRANLSAANFPFNSNFMGRTVIIPRYDQNRVGVSGFSGADADGDVGIPQIFYGHNIMPTGQGFKSVAYTSRANAYRNATNFDKAITIFDGDNNKALYVPGGGYNYLLTGNSMPNWMLLTRLPGVAHKLITRSLVNQRSLLFVENTGCYEIDLTAKTFNTVTLVGVTATDLKGMCSASNYNIAWDDVTVYWSSPADELDFTPSLTTGAGQGTPTELKGRIITCVPISGGFIIYTTANAVYAYYSGNALYPWMYREVADCGGVSDAEHISADVISNVHYAWTSAGLCVITATKAAPQFPEVTDFLAGKYFEDYDKATDSLVSEYLTKKMVVRVNYVASRYLVLSYGKKSFTHALVYDSNLKRWGKLKLNHVDCFEWNEPNYIGTRAYSQLAGRSYASLEGISYADISTEEITASSAKENVCFLQENGAIVQLDFSPGNFNSDAVLMLGKFQLTRAREVTLQETTIENIDVVNPNFLFKVYTAFDGKNFARISTPVQTHEEGLVRTYKSVLVGMNHTLGFFGSFDMVSVLLNFTQHGVR